MSIQYGRLEAAGQPVLNDTPSVKVAAMLSNQDSVIDALQGLTAKMDADSGGGGDELYVDEVYLYAVYTPTACSSLVPAMRIR